MNLDAWYLVCSGYTKIPPSYKEVQKNSKALSDIFCSIHDSTLYKIMHFRTTNQVWDKLHAVHEEDSSSRKHPVNPFPNNVSKMSDGFVESKEDMLQEIFYFRTKLDLALKNIVNLKDKLEEYDNKDHASMVSKQYCEGLEAKIVSLKQYLENSNKWNE